MTKEKLGFADKYFGSLYLVPLTLSAIILPITIFGFIVSNSHLIFDGLILLGLTGILPVTKKMWWSDSDNTKLKEGKA